MRLFHEYLTVPRSHFNKDSYHWYSLSIKYQLHLLWSTFSHWLLSPFPTGIKVKGQTLPSSPVIIHSAPNGPQMTIKSTVSSQGSMEIVKIPQTDAHFLLFSSFIICKTICWQHIGR